MLYILAAILVLVPVLLIKLKLDDDLYRFLKVVFLKSDTITKIKRKVVVVFMLLYAFIAIMIVFSFNTQEMPSSDYQSHVIDVDDENHENITILVPDNAKSSNEKTQTPDDKNVEFASLMMDMDLYISENSMPLAGNISERDVETLKSMASAYIALLDNRIDIFQSRFESLGVVTHSERSAFTKKLKVIKSDKEKHLSDIEKLIKSKSAYSDLLFNYFVFENKLECLDFIANDKVSSWVGLDCNSSNEFAFIFSKTKHKDTSSIIRLKADLKSCDSVKCLTTQGKVVRKGFVSASKTYLETQTVFGKSLYPVISTDEDLLLQKKESNTISINKTDTLKSHDNTEINEISKIESVSNSSSYPSAMKWQSFTSKNNKNTNINMVVFREFGECDKFKSKLADKIQKELDCGSSKNIQKIKINGEVHDLSGFAYIFKRKSLDHVESFPIFKSESGSYVYPNGAAADETGLHLGTVPKDIESKFMVKN